jgi:nucleotide-binding universal stress UspA family protein
MNIARHTGAEVVLVHAGAVHEHIAENAGPPPSQIKAYEAVLSEYQAENRRQLEELREKYAGQGVDVSHMIIDGFADTSVCKAAEELGANLICVGTHGRTGVKRFLLGSIAERVVRLADTSVLVARPRVEGAGGFSKILVPSDFSPSAERALRAALLVAAKGATIDVLHCWQLPALTAGYYVPGRTRDAVVGPLVDAIESDARARADALLARYRRDDVALTFDVTEAPPAHAILERAPGYELIVTGSHGRRGIRRFVLGSVAEVTVRHAPCSVMVVHGEEA